MAEHIVGLKPRILSQDIPAPDGSGLVGAFASTVNLLSSPSPVLYTGLSEVNSNIILPNQLPVPPSWADGGDPFLIQNTGLPKNYPNGSFQGTQHTWATQHPAEAPAVIHLVYPFPCVPDYPPEYGINPRLASFSAGGVGEVGGFHMAYYYSGSGNPTVAAEVQFYDGFNVGPGVYGDPSLRYFRKWGNVPEVGGIQTFTPFPSGTPGGGDIGNDPMTCRRVQLVRDDHFPEWATGNSVKITSAPRQVAPHEPAITTFGLFLKLTLTKDVADDNAYFILFFGPAQLYTCSILESKQGV